MIDANKPIGFRHESYACPWCDATFSYNGCQAFTAVPAGKEWREHVKKNHGEEYKKIMDEKPLNINAVFDLMRGKLPKEK
jgi:hypothetical protein